MNKGGLLVLGLQAFDRNLVLPEQLFWIARFRQIDITKLQEGSIDLIAQP